MSVITRTYLAGPVAYLVATILAVVSAASSVAKRGAIAVFFIVESSVFGRRGVR